MTSEAFGQAMSRKPKVTVALACVFLASVVLAQMPLFNLVFAPINTFVTAVHELSHALVCLMTGGSVAGLTIVADGQGHGGLTFCRGGNAFLYTQAGYLGTTVFGCLLIALSHYPRLARVALGATGLAIALTSLTLMLGTVLMPGQLVAAVGSIFWGLLIGGGLLFAAVKLGQSVAYWLLLFLALQTSLNALTSLFFLTQSSMAAGGPWSDATNMQEMTGIPAFVWAGLWSLISIAMLGVTMWWTMKADFGKR